MSDTAITDVRARRVWDSRGHPTIEVEITLACGARGRAIAPAGASTGSAEAREKRDGGPALGGRGVAQAIAGVHDRVAPAIRARDATDQAGLDARLRALDGTEDFASLGANAAVAVSMAAAWAAAGALGQPLWQHLRAGEAPAIPLPEIQIFGGGAHADRRVDVQDFMVMPIGAATVDAGFEMVAEVYAAAGHALRERGALQGVADEGGYWPAFDSSEATLAALCEAIERAGLRPGVDLTISLDVAASEFFRDGQYRIEGRSWKRDAWIDELCRWVDRYPIASIEDPLDEHDRDGMAAITRAIGERVQIVGDDYLVTNAARVRDAARVGACNAVLIKPNQAGTVTAAHDAWKAAREVGFGAIVSARSGDSEDITLVHLAVGWGVPQVKVGSITRGERTAKWNELIRIEEAGGPGAFVGASALPAQWRDKTP